MIEFSSDLEILSHTHMGNKENDKMTQKKVEQVRFVDHIYIQDSLSIYKKRNRETRAGAPILPVKETQGFGKDCDKGDCGQ